MNCKDYFISIDLGGTFIKGAIVCGDGSICSNIAQTPSNSHLDRETISLALNEVIDELVNQFDKPIKAVLICIPGPCDYEKGVSLMKHKYVSLYQTKLASLIKNQKIKNLPILFENDAISFAYGGYYYNHLECEKTVVAITLGTGLGYVQIDDGIVVRNTLGSPEKVMYNVPFLDGIMEDYLSSRGIVNLYKKMTNKVISSPKALYDLAQNDAEALACFKEFGRLLVEAINVFTNDEINAIILGGAISKSYALFSEAFESKPYKVIVNDAEIALIGNVINYYRR